MTSVPKPLKFLRPRYAELKATFEGMPAGDNRSALANVLSVLAMNSGAEGAREALTFRLAGTPATASSWGHEYIRCTREFRANVQKIQQQGSGLRIVLSRHPCAGHMAQA